MSTHNLLPLVRLTVIGLLLNSCVHAPGNIKSQYASAESEVLETIRSVFAAGKRGDIKTLESFHLYGPQFSRLDPDGTRYLAEESRQGEAEFYSAKDTNLECIFDSMRADVFDKRFAVATFFAHCKYRWANEDIETKDKVTFVMIRQKDGWKIAHENFAHLPGFPITKKVQGTKTK